MTTLDTLLRAVHEMTGGLGVRIFTSTINGSPEAYSATVTWRVWYRMPRDDGQHEHWRYSEKREASGDTVEKALRNAIAANESIERSMVAALTKKVGDVPAVVPIAEEVRAARLAGYEGEPCPICERLTVVRSGSAFACDWCKQRWSTPPTNPR